MDELVTIDPTNVYLIKLNTEHITRFNLLNQTFVRLADSTNEISPGFYNMLYEGQSRLYKKINKVIKESFSSQILHRVK